MLVVNGVNSVRVHPLLGEKIFSRCHRIIRFGDQIKFSDTKLRKIPTQAANITATNSLLTFLNNRIEQERTLLQVKSVLYTNMQQPRALLPAISVLPKELISFKAI
jgi:hypothetical protein